jgi:hypothetical protein
MDQATRDKMAEKYKRLKQQRNAEHQALHRRRREALAAWGREALHGDLVEVIRQRLVEDRKPHWEKPRHYHITDRREAVKTLLDAIDPADEGNAEFVAWLQAWLRRGRDRP